MYNELLQCKVSKNVFAKRSARADFDQLVERLRKLDIIEEVILVMLQRPELLVAFTRVSFAEAVDDLLNLHLIYGQRDAMRWIVAMGPLSEWWTSGKDLSRCLRAIFNAAKPPSIPRLSRTAQPTIFRE